MTTLQEIIEEIKQELKNGSDIEDIADRSHEYVENYVPVYNNLIIKEWADMPGDYDNRGHAELGSYDEEIDIISLMQKDLYVYYTELFSEAMTDVEQELEESN